MTLSDTLWNTYHDLAIACLEHPFVQGIAQGTLPKATFAYYVGQDAFFLEAFARAYSIAAAKTPDWESFGIFHNLASGVFEELKLHTNYAQEWGVDLSATVPGAATRRYTDFLQAVAWSQNVGVTTAAMLPCMRLYSFLGQELAKSGIPDHLYKGWIETYNDPLFATLADQLGHLADRYADPNSTTVRATYGYAMQCELDFFEAAWCID